MVEKQTTDCSMLRSHAQSSGAESATLIAVQTRRPIDAALSSFVRDPLLARLADKTNGIHITSGGYLTTTRCERALVAIHWKRPRTTVRRLAWRATHRIGPPFNSAAPCCQHRSSATTHVASDGSARRMDDRSIHRFGFLFLAEGESLLFP